MQRAACQLLLALALLVSGALDAHAGKRVAFVVGNDDYVALPKLQKAVNDSRAVARALEEIGFTVITGENLTRRNMNRRLADLLGAIAPGDQVFFYFAGHGVALGAENYLIPSDMPKPGTGQQSLVRDEGYAVSSLVNRVRERGASSTIFVLDACRDNPFASVGVRSIGGTRGFTRMEAPSGVFLLFSAGIGQTALDRLPGNDVNPNSVFTRKLVPLLKTPGLTHVSLAKQVQEEVDALARKVGHQQQPAYYDQIIGNIVLRPGTASEGPATKTKRPQAPISHASQAWATIQASASPAVIEAFIREFPDSVYATFAKARLAELKEQKVAVGVFPEKSRPKEQAKKFLIGLSIAPLSAELRTRHSIPVAVEGVVITEVEASSSAAEKNIKAGNVIVEINGEKIETPSDVAKRVDTARKAGRKLILLLLSDSKGFLRFVAVPFKN